MAEPPPEASEDSAWVAVDTALAAPVLRDIIDDPERPLRVNSGWIFEHWEWLNPARVRLRIRNGASGQVLDTDAEIARAPDGVRLVYADGLKAWTQLRVEDLGAGSRLWIVEDYSRLPEAEREQRKDEVDTTLPAWGRDLQRYLAAWARYGRFALWRWYMERVWRPMKPLARRIVRLVFWVSVAELAVFLLLIGVLVAERGR